jgi:hypothetical protein
MKYDIDGHLWWAPVKKPGRGWIAYKDSASSPKAPVGGSSQGVAAPSTGTWQGMGAATPTSLQGNTTQSFLGNQSGMGQSPYGYTAPAQLNGGINDSMPMNNAPTALGSQLAAQYFGGNSGPAVPATWNGAPVGGMGGSLQATPDSFSNQTDSGYSAPQFSNPSAGGNPGMHQAMAAALRQGPTQFGSPPPGSPAMPIPQRPMPPQYRPNPQSLPVYNPAGGPRGR